MRDVAELNTCRGEATSDCHLLFCTCRWALLDLQFLPETKKYIQLASPLVYRFYRHPKQPFFIVQ